MSYARGMLVFVATALCAGGMQLVSVVVILCYTTYEAANVGGRVLLAAWTRQCIGQPRSSSSSSSEQAMEWRARQIVVEQRDLHFNHPATAVTVWFKPAAGCAGAANVKLRCSAAQWGNAGGDLLADPAQLRVAGDGTCLLYASRVIPAMSSVSFVYLHSPPLDLQPLSFDCAH